MKDVVVSSSGGVDVFQDAISNELSKNFEVAHCNQQQFEEQCAAVLHDHPSFTPRTVIYTME
jgi:hypothetical protein